MAICGCVTEPRRQKARICLMQKGHEGPHFDVIPFKVSTEKFYGSAKGYAKKDKNVQEFCKVDDNEIDISLLVSQWIQELKK